jgi:hypothetical protein
MSLRIELPHPDANIAGMPRDIQNQSHNQSRAG